MSQEGTDTDRALARALFAVQDLRARLNAIESDSREPIAVVGMSCRFPGPAGDLASFWSLLERGESGITEVPADRWDIDAYYDPDPNRLDRMYTRWGGFVRDLDQFAPRFFEISPREALMLDPQHRLLLEGAWGALENAAIDPTSLRETSTGVFVGISGSDFGTVVQSEARQVSDLYIGTGTADSAASGRVSYWLGLQGPAISVDTACSSSLTSLHLALQSLQRRECDLALAAGVNVSLSALVTMTLCRGRMLAADGKCKTFDAAADGYVRSEGCGVIVLKRMSDAIASGDRVMAVLRGSAINQDGRSAGLTAPSETAQEALLRAALRNAGLTADDVDYIETHGTGTRLGDPIEMRAIQRVYGARTTDRPLIVGSVKTNIGHLEAGAGVASIIKVILSLLHDSIPPHLNLSTPNPQIEWDRYPIEIPRRLERWCRSDRPRIAGVSGFGFSGTNVHVIVQEAPIPPIPSPSARTCSLVTLSARTPSALRVMATNLERHLETSEDSLPAVAFSANVGRARFEHRAAVVASTTAEARARLRNVAEEQRLKSAGGPAAQGAPSLAFVYTGQGSQYSGMGRALYETQPIFREVIEECSEVIGPIQDRSLAEWLYSSDSSTSDEVLQNTGFAQPALFAIECGLTRLWNTWGIEPNGVLGHSVGEFAAASAAGVFSMADGMTLIAARARLMQALPSGGGMLAVTGDEGEVRAAMRAFDAPISLAVVNGATDFVVAGALEDLERLKAALTQRRLSTKFLAVSHAFHSHLMKPMIEEFRAVAERITYHAPRVPMISNVTGRQVSDAEPIDADYWCRHILAPVQFGPSIRNLRRAGYEVFLEIGPHPVLSVLGQKIDPDGKWLSSLRRGKDDWTQLLEALGELFVLGADFDARALESPDASRKVGLPTYPFERERVWFTDMPEASREPRSNTSGIRSALTGDIVVQTEISPSTDPFLNEHRVFGEAIYPAAGYVSVALTALARIHPDQPFELRDFQLHAPVRVPDDGRKQLQTVLSAAGSARYRLDVFVAESKAGAGAMDSSWTRVASGEVHVGASAPSGPAPSVVESRCETSVTKSEFYGYLAELGIDFGPLYRRVDGAQTGLREAVVRVEPDPSSESGALDRFSPMRLDAALFQMVAVRLQTEPDDPRKDRLFLPVAADRIYVAAGDASATGLTSVLQAGRFDPANPDALISDVWCYGDDGTVVTALIGFRSRLATRETLRRATRSISEWLYEIAWLPATDRGEHRAPEDRWLILGDRHGVGSALTDRLRAGGATCALIEATNNDATNNDANQHVHATGSATLTDVRRMIAAAAAAAPQAPLGIVHCWTLDLAPGTNLESHDNLGLGLASAVGIVQAMLAGEAGAAPRAWFVSRGAAYTAPVAAPGRPAAAALPALVSTLVSEHEHLRVCAIDLDSTEDLERDASAILSEIQQRITNEPVVAFRGGGSLVPRLSAAGGRAPVLSVPSTPFALTIGRRGVLDNLAFTPLPALDPPAAGVVHIEVAASGLNFRDVLNALGMYPGDAGHLGSECAGRVVAVGAGVDHLRVGDRVMAIAERAFSTVVSARAALVQPIPDDLLDEDAATLPVTYLTAEYALSYLGRMRTGERVLIHAGAGGVGLAAIRLAQQAGLEVFATAGSPEKRAYLASIGVAHVMDSRSLTFATEILKLTNGEGVDLVLNSLTGQFIDKGLSLLRAGGRFLEIGKTDLWPKERVAREFPGVEYIVLDLGDICRDDPPAVQSMFARLNEAVRTGHLPILRRQVFPIGRVRDAFRFMAQAKHIGKIVVAHTPPPGRFRANATYLITGGMGGLGLTIARWMVEGGARHLVLVGRSAPSDATTEAIAALEGLGATVVVARLDISRPEAVADLALHIPPSLPLRGIIHAAGVLDDGLVEHMTEERLERVYGPKVMGAKNLYLLAKDTALDFFLLFSSTATVFGSPGQSNYAAANAVLDALAHEWRAAGVPATTINWGPWSDVGMAARLGTREHDRWSARGFHLIDPAGGLEALAAILQSDRPQTIVAPIDWTAFLRHLGKVSVPAFLSEVVARREATGHDKEEDTAFLNEFQASEQALRGELLERHVRQQIGHVLGLDPSSIGQSDRSLAELGMDSLMAVELSNRFKVSLNRSFSPTIALEYQTIGALTAFLLTQVAVEADHADGGRDLSAADREEVEF